MDNTTQAEFAALAGLFDEAEAATGARVWPALGTHDCYLDSVEINTKGVFRMGQNTIPALVVTPVWTLVEDPDRPEPLTFKGAEFELPKNPSDVTAENQRQRMTITMGRLKTFLMKILGKPEADIKIPGSVIEVQQLLTQDAAVICAVEITQRTFERRDKSQGIAHTDWVKECKAGPHINAPA